MCVGENPAFDLRSSLTTWELGCVVVSRVIGSYPYELETNGFSEDKNMGQAKL